MLDALTAQFCACIPHAGRVPTIASLEAVGQKMQLVEELAELERSAAVVREAAENGSLNPLDAKYTSLQRALDPVPRGSDAWRLVDDYVARTHGPTHAFRVVLEGLFELDSGEPSAIAKRARRRDRAAETMLLWHGSRTTNYAGILRQSLRIAPPEVGGVGCDRASGPYFAPAGRCAEGDAHLGQFFWFLYTGRLDRR